MRRHFHPTAGAPGGGFSEGICVAGWDPGAPRPSAVALTTGFRGQRESLQTSAGRKFASGAFSCLLPIDGSGSYSAKCLHEQFCFFVFSKWSHFLLSNGDQHASSPSPTAPPPLSQDEAPAKPVGRQPGLPQPWPNSVLFDIPANPGPTRCAGTVFVWRAHFHPLP